MFKFFLAFSLLIATAASLRVDGPCRTDIRPRDGFNQQQYMGLWYELERYEDNFATFEGSECGTAIYATTHDGGIRLHLEGRLDGQQWEEVGYGEVAFLHLEPVPAIWNTSFNVPGSEEGHLTILSTDYINYSLVWSCEDLPDGNSNESFWFLSRSPGLPTRNPTVLARSAIHTILFKLLI